MQRSDVSIFNNSIAELEPYGFDLDRMLGVTEASAVSASED